MISSAEQDPRKCNSYTCIVLVVTKKCRMTLSHDHNKRHFFGDYEYNTTASFIVTICDILCVLLRLTCVVLLKVCNYFEFQFLPRKTPSEDSADNPINQALLSTFSREENIKYDVAKNRVEVVEERTAGPRNWGKAPRHYRCIIFRCRPSSATKISHVYL